VPIPEGGNNPSGKGGFKERPGDINREGRTRRAEMDIFKEALDKVEKEKNMTLAEFAIRKAFESPSYKCVLSELIRKMYPSMQNVNIENFSLDMLSQIIRKQKEK